MVGAHNEGLRECPLRCLLALYSQFGWHDREINRRRSFSGRHRADSRAFVRASGSLYIYIYIIHLYVYMATPVPLYGDEIVSFLSADMGSEHRSDFIRAPLSR